MGSIEFQNVVWGSDSVESAYHGACADALDEYGNRGYNGTISTTDGVQAVTNSPMSESGARWYANYFTCFEESSKSSPKKWEYALAVPLARDDAFTFHTEVFDVEVPSELLGEITQVIDSTAHRVTREAYRAAIAQFPNLIHTVKVSPSLKYRYVTENATGAARTRYEVWDCANSSRPISAHDTKPQARAAMKKALDRGVYTSVGIKAVKEYSMGHKGYASVMRRELVSGSIRVEVTVAIPKADAKISGWLFYGLAST